MKLLTLRSLDRYNSAGHRSEVRRRRPASSPAIGSSHTTGPGLSPERPKQTYFAVAWVEYLRERGQTKNEASEIVATGYPRHVCLNPATTKMVALPDWLKESIADAAVDPADR